MAEKTISNVAMRMVLDASEQVLGKNGLKAILAYNNLGGLLENRPDYSYEKNFTDEQYSAIGSSYVKVLGIDGVRAVFRLIGKTIAVNSIDAGLYNPFTDLPPEEKLFKAIETYSVAAGRGRTFREGGVIVFDNTKCSMCKDIVHDRPMCSIYNGFMDRLIEWAGIKGMRSVETSCMSMGAPSCRYEILSVD